MNKMLTKPKYCEQLPYLLNEIKRYCQLWGTHGGTTHMHTKKALH